LSLEERAAALGEKVAVAPKAKSVFEMISSDGRAKLSASLANAFHVGETMVVGEIVHFPNDPAKQARFLQFCKEKRGDDATRDWRRALELQEFETLAATLPTAVKTEAAPKKSIPTDYGSAARLGMFGKLTRENEDWIPPRLLCKRFHVPDPNQGKAVAAPTIATRTRFDELLASIHPEMIAAQNPVKVVEEKEEVVVKEERPPVDLFKAIFNDSDDDDDDDEKAV